MVHEYKIYLWESSIIINNDKEGIYIDIFSLVCVMHSDFLRFD